MWECALAAAADHLNCMDRSRGFGGHQFDDQPHLVQRPFEWSRNCFSCGQQGHVARDCSQRVGRGVAINAGSLYGGGYPNGWLAPGLRPLPIHSREPEFLLNREDGQQGWQQQVTRGDFAESRNPGCTGRGLGSRNLSFIPSRGVDRPRERRSGWVDVGPQSHVSVCTRPSDESYVGGYKKNRPRRVTTKRNCGHRKDLEGNDALLRALPNSCSSACDDSGKGCLRDKRGTTLEPSSGTLFELSHGKPGHKVQSDWQGDAERRGLYLPSASADLHNGVFRDGNYELTSALHGKNAGNGNHESVPEIYNQAARPALVGKEDSLGSIDELENGEILREDNVDQALESENNDIFASSHGADDGDDRLLLQQVPREQPFCNNIAIEGKKPAIKVIPSADMEVARVKTELKDKQEAWSRFGSISTFAASGCAEDNGLNTCLERKFDRDDREGSEWFSARSDLDQVGDRDVCRCNPRSNSSCVCFVNGYEISNRGGERNSWQEVHLDPSAHGEMAKRPYQNYAGERELQNCRSNLEWNNSQCDNWETSSAASKRTESQPPMVKALSSVPGPHLNTGMVWSGQNSRGWNKCGNTNEQAASLTSDIPGCTGGLYIDNTGISGPLVLADSKLWQPQSEHIVGSNGSRGFVVEQGASSHMSDMQGAWLQQEASCNVLTVKNVDRSDRNCLQPEGIDMKSSAGEEEYNIDARVEKLMSNFPLVEGREQDSVADALMAASQRVSEDEFEGESEGSGYPNYPDGNSGVGMVQEQGCAPVPHISFEIHHLETKNDVSAEFQVALESAQLYVTSPSGPKLISQVSNVRCWKFPTAGGDWKLTQTERSEATGVLADKVLSWRKEVMNRGVSVCEVENSGVSDPRRQPHAVACLQQIKLDVPGWACGSVDKVENAIDGLPGQYSHPTGATPGRNVSTFNSQLSVPVSHTTKGVVTTPRTSKAPAVGINSTNGVIGTPGKESGKGTKSSRKPVHSRSSAQKVESLGSSRKTVLAADQIAATVTSKVGLVPGAPATNDAYTRSLGDHNDRTGSQKSVEQLTYLPPHTSQKTASDSHNLPSYRSRGSSVTFADSQNPASVVLRRHELQLESGVWHYLDAAGHERGPFLMSALLSVVAERRLPDGASVYRKSDNIWVPVSHLIPYPQACALAPAPTGMPVSCSSLSSEDTEFSPSEPLPPSAISTSRDPAALPSKEPYTDSSTLGVSSLLFHREHPQFLGYTNGKLHELVMRSFRGTFAGFLEDSLGIWLDNKQRSVIVPAVMAFVSTSEETPASTSPLAGVTCPSTSVEPCSGLRNSGGKSSNENRQGETVKSQKESTKDRHGKEDTSDLDLEAKRKRSLSLPGEIITGGNSSPGMKNVSSPVHRSLSSGVNADQLMSQEFPPQSPHSSQTSDIESPCNVNSRKIRKEKAADSVPLGSETVSSKEDGSPSVAEHNSWVGGGHCAKDVQLRKRSLPQRSIAELDGSNSSTATEVAAHASMTYLADIKAREVSSDQEYSETGVVDPVESKMDGGGSAKDGLRQEGWAGLPSSVLKMVLHLLCGDPKSLTAAMATCQSWKECAQNIKVSAKHVDLSGLGRHCNDAILGSLLGYGSGNLQRITLNYCTNVSCEKLGLLLKAYPAIGEVEIKGCVQLRGLVDLYPQVRWVGNPWETKNPHHGPIPQAQSSQNHKARSVKRIGEKRATGQGFDGDSGCSIDETGYRDKSTEDRESLGAERMLIDLVDPLAKDTEAHQVGHGQSRDAKRRKVSTGKGGRSGLCSGTGKYSDQQNIVNGDDKGSRLKAKRDAYSMDRKLKAKLAYKKQTSMRHSSKKATLLCRKPETVGKEVLCSPRNAEKDLEKELAAALKTVMEADSDQVFFRLANEQVPDGRGASGKTVQMDFYTVQKKLKMGLYGGKEGVKMFKNDILQPLRSAFRLEQDTLLYKTAGRIFKVAHQVGRQLDNFLSRAHSKDHTQGQSRAPGNCIVSTRNPTKSRGPKYSVSEKQRGTKRAWELAAVGRVVKGKVSINKLDGDIGGGDYDREGSLDRDRDREESRHVRRRNQWSESEAESSDEEEVDETLYDEPEEEDTETSGSDVGSKSEVADEAMEDYNEETESDDTYSGLGEDGSSRDWWGARMTKAAMVPPLTRKYEVIEEYRIVDDVERVASKMKVELPDDYEEKLRAAKEKGGERYAHLDVPELKESKPRKRLGEEVLEQEVYGIDPFTYNLLLNTMPADTVLYTERQKQLFIEEKLLRVLNKEVSSFTGSGKAPMEYSLEKVITKIFNDAHGDQALQVFCTGLLKNMRSHVSDKYVAYRKGLGVVCNKPEGFDEGDFVVEFFGEVYPPWRWYEKQDGIRSVQKKDKDPAPEFYNIVFERPKGDSSGYDVLVVDAMHKANFASRLCHSCRPNCEAKVTAVNGKYMIGVYTLRKIEFGEELTFDYCCVTESKEEHDSSVCLCGSQGCKGSYLGYTGPGAYDEVLKECHGILDRHNLLLQACTSGSVTVKELEELKQAGLGTCLLEGLPHWVIKYAAGIVSYLNSERKCLPEELMKAEALKHSGVEIDRQDIEVQTEGVYNQRLQNLAITLDKVRHILTKLYGQASMAPPPLRMLEPHELVEYIWKGKYSVVGELLQCMAVHAPEGLMDLTRQIREHNPPPGGDVEGNLRKSLLWLRDTLRKVPATCMGRHDAAADLIHLYAYTKHFFTNHDYGLVESEPLLIYACDLGPKHSGAPPVEFNKSYSKNYVWGQLISWFRQTSADPGASLVLERRGCLMLPDVSSCYARTPQHDFRCGYSDKDRRLMISHMENRPQTKWTRKYTPALWNFKSDRGLYGSPMLDAVVSKSKLNKECINWLKNRETVFRGPWDEE